MARVFKRKDRLSAMSEINLTSLMDLVFCLLIIFMITTPLLEQTIPVNLPLQSRNADSNRDKKLKFQVVSIDAQGRYFWGSEPVDSDRLRTLLQALAAQPDPPVISVRGDADIPYQKVIDVVDLIKQAGLVKLNLDTKVK
ncbi:MAG: biopolymer transporter ExbD [Opitutales bacterium]|jgi:biopolymer transport protein ExbD